ncbi:MAG TPA: histone deacetylase family protein [Anaerolineales bacterium]|nr:histone deacetylase family protein [Anaerolineales bacterium]
MITVYAAQHALHATDQITVKGLPWPTEELPVRAELIRQAIIEAQLGEIIPPRDFGLAPIQAVHAPGFLDYLQTVHARNAALHAGRPSAVFPNTFATRPVRHTSPSLDAQKGYYCFEVYTPVLEGTWAAAYWSAQCALTAARIVQTGAPAAYALCRPPGHHAAVDLYGGFCFLNNAAIAARSLSARIAILDIDFHHGNGTQEIFYSDPDTLYCSLHADPDVEYPYYWGGADETGAGAGTGTNLNLPLAIGTTDETYLPTLDQALERIQAFAPRYLLVSLGLDIAAQDPVGGFRITLPGMAEIGRRIKRLGLPTVLVQEGGYHLDVLGSYAVAFLSNF